MSTGTTSLLLDGVRISSSGCCALFSGTNGSATVDVVNTAVVVVSHVVYGRGSVGDVSINVANSSISSSGAGLAVGSGGGSLSVTVSGGSFATSNYVVVADGSLPVTRLAVLMSDTTSWTVAGAVDATSPLLSVTLNVTYLHGATSLIRARGGVSFLSVGFVNASISTSASLFFMSAPAHFIAISAVASTFVGSSFFDSSATKAVNLGISIEASHIESTGGPIVSAGDVYYNGPATTVRCSSCTLTSVGGGFSFTSLAGGGVVLESTILVVNHVGLLFAGYSNSFTDYERTLSGVSVALTNTTISVTAVGPVSLTASGK